jgi:hypothetical protein
MPSSSGPNTVNDSIIFTYDTGDLKNSFKGRPATNLLTNLANTYGTNNSSTFKTFYYNRTLYVPQLGTTTVTTLNNYNDYNGGSGVCCEQIFSYGTGISVSGNTLYTYSIIYRSQSGYTHPNMMYRYEYGPGGYQTEGGVFSDSNRTDLGEGWYHAWGTFTTQPNTTSVNTYNFIYEYATYNVIDIAAAMLIQGNFILPPANFIPFNTTRQTTQGLLDISGRNNTITLANSYTSNAQITFDGTDDFIGVGNLGNIGEFTIEIVFKSDSVSNYRNPMDCNWLVYSGGYSNIGPRLEQNSSGNLGWVVGDSSGNYTGINVVSSGMSGAPFHYAAITRTSSNFIAYYNGTQSGTAIFNNWYGAFSNVTFGRGFSTSGERWFNGQIPLVKIYNRVLSAAEIKNNYNEYKTRFNLP